MAADEIVFAKLRECPAVETASSEEQSEMLDMGGRGFSVSSASTMMVHLDAQLSP